MSRLPRIAALSLLGVSLAAPPAALPTGALAQPMDGEATPAACRPLGFELAPAATPPVLRPARVAEWRLIGYETRLLNEEDFTNDRVDAGEVGSGASVTALYEITPVGGPTQIPERRYPDNRIGVGGGDPNGEIGFIQVRYKQPGQSRSELIQQPLANRAASPVGAQPPEATRWAIAVAAFGQKLRGDPWMAADYGWDRIVDQAQGARGEDPYGDRAEFVQLVRAAASLPSPGTP